MKGHIYALINPSFNGLVKIGKTTRSPEERAKELSTSTGVPTPFIVGYSCLVSDCDKAESHIHALLSSQGYRLSENREFFQANLNQIVKLFIECERLFAITDSHDQEHDLKEHPENAESLINSLLQEANDLAEGENGSFINHEEAKDKLQTAAKLGSSEAYYRLALLYKNSDSELYNSKKSILMLNAALKYDYNPFHCYSELGAIYCTNHDQKNAHIAYNKLFNEIGLDEIINAYIDHQNSKKLSYSNDDIDSEEDEFIRDVGRELHENSLLLNNEEAIAQERQEIVHCVAMSLVWYFTHVGIGFLQPIASDSVPRLFELTRAFADLIPESSSTNFFEIGIQKYIDEFCLEAD